MESAWLLVIGGGALLPLTAKGGASEVYLLPLVAAVATLGGRLFGRAETGQDVRPTDTAHAAAGPTLATIAALLLLALHPARNPTRQDELTARFFYDYVLAHSSRVGRRLFAAMPNWAYFLAGQPLDVQGSDLPYLVEGNVTGTEGILRRVVARDYGIIVMFAEVWPPKQEWQDALRYHYALAGACRLGYNYGTVYQQLLFLPRGEPHDFEPPEGARCWRASAGLAPPRSN